MSRGLSIFVLVLPMMVAVAQAPPSGPDAIHNAALADVVKAANELCIATPLDYHESRVTLSGDAKAKVNGVIGKLVDLGIGGAAQYQQTNAKGILQQQLAQAIATSDNCKLAVLRELKAMIPELAAPPQSAPQTQPPTQTQSPPQTQSPLPRQPPSQPVESVSNQFTSLSTQFESTTQSLVVTVHGSYSGDHDLVRLTVCALQDEQRWCSQSGVTHKKPEVDFISSVYFHDINGGDPMGRRLDLARPIDFRVCYQLPDHRYVEPGATFGCAVFKRPPS